MKHMFILGVGLFLVVTAAAPAFAGLGFHAGMSIDPEDFLIGVRFRSHPLGEAIYLVPSLEAGFGDVTMIAGNLDAHYAFKTSSELRPYGGGGVTLNWFDLEDDNDIEFGGSVLGGIYIKPAVFFETKIGLGDVPDWKIVVGWNR